MKILQHRGQRDALHRLPNGVFDLVVGAREHLLDVPGHRTGALAAGMDADEGGEALRLQSAVDLIQRDLLRRNACILHSDACSPH